MKKTLSLILSILLIAGMCMVPVAAEAAPQSELSDSLIWHYDFNGATESEYLYDKSTGGATTEYIANGESAFKNYVTVADGVMSMSGLGQASTHLSSEAGKKGADYLTNATGEFTFYLNFRLEGDDLTKGGFHDLVKTSNNSIRIYTAIGNTTNNTEQLYIRNNISNNAELKAGIKIADVKYSHGDEIDNTFYRLAWTMKYDSVKAVWTHNVYLSSDSGVTYDQVLTNVEAADSATFFNAATFIALGGANSNRPDFVKQFEDFRIYNKALTSAELATIDVKKAPIWNYAFNGTESSEYLYDSAENGSSVEYIAGNEGAFADYSTVADGVLKLTGLGQANTHLSSTAGAKGSDYLNNATGAFTFYLSFRLEGDDATKGGFHDLVKTSNNSIRIYTAIGNTTNNTEQLYIRNNISNNAELKAGIKIADVKYSHGDEIDNTFYRLAWTMKYDATNQVWIHNAYLSSDSGVTYDQVLTNVEAADSATFFNAATSLSLGGTNANRPDFVKYFDDFRIYDSALTAEELTEVDSFGEGAQFNLVQSDLVAGNATHNVRFIGSIESLNYAKVGFEITAQDGAYAWNKDATEVYTSLLGKTEGGELDERSSLQVRGAGTYLYALTIEGVPTDGTVTFTVKPYSQKAGTDEVVYGTAYTITYVDGVFSSSAVAN